MADLDALVAAARATAPPERREIVVELARALLAHAESDDIDGLSPATLVDAALAQVDHAGSRPAGDAVVWVGNPDAATEGWASPHTVVEAVTDDMPFLVDSVVAALGHRGLGVHRAWYPLVSVLRDEQGRIAGAGGAAAPEAFLHFEVDRETDPAALAALGAHVRNVLADVRAAVGDWAAMSERAVERAAELRARPPATVDPEEAAEAARFLEWLASDHFTFVGCCRYDLVDRDGVDAIHLVEDSRLGVLRRRQLSEYSTTFASMGAETRRRARDPWVLTLTKTLARSTVHRDVPLDYVGVKRFDADGTIVGEDRFTGLYTATVYTEPTGAIPVVRRKVAAVIGRAALPAAGHDGRALANILETLPRNELLRLPVDELSALALGILRMGERRRVRLFVSRDAFGRFVSCLVYLPRDRYTTRTRVQIVDALRTAFRGTDTAFTVLVTETLLARLHVVVDTPDPLVAVDTSVLERDLGRITRSWTDDLREALVASLGEEAGLDALRRYGDAFPPGYQADVAPDEAVGDLTVLELLDPRGDLRIRVEPRTGADDVVRMSLYRTGAPLVLSDVMPLLDHLGVTVVDERPYDVRPVSASLRWISTFGLEAGPGDALRDPTVQARVAELFLGVWSGAIENDALNALVVRAGLTVRDVVIVRAISKYLRQAEVRVTEQYLADTLVANPHATRLVVELFRARFDPARHLDPRRPASAEADAVARELGVAIDAVVSLDEDRIFRSLLAVVDAAVRTNAFQTDLDGNPKAALAVKLDPERLDFLPAPRPKHEVWVYSPRVEAVHLRAGDVARGGIRWSDRREDFRTEVLGLMKAQTVKNSVIVPVGAKGGFVVKRLARDADRQATQREVLECYRIFMRSLLDVTDNLVDGAVVPPDVVVRYDDDDPYLVVAADKGTATFSDHANAIAAEYGYWLGDAFASGGSTGYDHKAMAITARGAWVSVRAHLRAQGVDADVAPLTVVGIGDMSGDVFGNGLLRSSHLRLVAAFDHRHVFLDPDPDPESSFAERLRLFRLPASSWADYDPALVSPGGGVFPRTAKSIALSPEVAAALGTEAGVLTPDEVVRTILRAPVDLMWNGGVGTFVKASAESNAQVGDRANDDVRVDASALRVRVVAEGGNLGFTQRGRVEAALAGVRINTDAIDNSAGVDCSDHEVNIKILLQPSLADGSLGWEERNELLTEMTDEVADLVLADNDAQANALEVAVSEAAPLVGMHARQIERLEQSGALDRGLEGLPDAKTIQERHATGSGLTAPELSVLLAYTKLELERALAASDLPDDPFLDRDLREYFPTPLRARFADAIAAHPLRSRLAATVVANAVVNRGGISFLSRLGDETGAPLDRLARAHVIAREVFGVASRWKAIDGLDFVVPAAVQDTMFLTARRLVERSARWLVHHGGGLELDPTIARFREGATALAAGGRSLLGEVAAARSGAVEHDLVEAGVPVELAAWCGDTEWLPGAFDLVELAVDRGEDLRAVAAVSFALAERLGLDWLRDRIGGLTRDDRWQAEARAALRDDCSESARALAEAVLRATESTLPAGERVEVWLAAHAAAYGRYRQVGAEVEAAGVFDLTTLAVVRRELSALVPSDPVS